MSSEFEIKWLNKSLDEKMLFYTDSLELETLLGYFEERLKSELMEFNFSESDFKKFCASLSESDLLFLDPLWEETARRHYIFLYEETLPFLGLPESPLTLRYQRDYNIFPLLAAKIKNWHWNKFLK